MKTIGTILILLLVCVLVGCDSSSTEPPGTYFIEYYYITPDGARLQLRVSRDQPVSVYTYHGVTYTYKLDGTFSAVTNVMAQ